VLNLLDATDGLLWPSLMCYRDGNGIWNYKYREYNLAELGVLQL